MKRIGYPPFGVGGNDAIRRRGGPRRVSATLAWARCTPAPDRRLTTPVPGISVGFLELGFGLAAEVARRARTANGTSAFACRGAEASGSLARRRRGPDER